jgi:ASC-1-like (ASCH) protein
MAEFLLRISFHNRPTGDDFLLVGRVYPASTTIKAGDWLVFGEMKIAVQAVEVSDYDGVTITISQDAVETLRRTGVALTKLYGTKIQLESATQQAEV